MRSAPQQIVERRIKGRQDRRTATGGVAASGHGARGLSRESGDAEPEAIGKRVSNLGVGYAAHDVANQGDLSRTRDLNSGPRSLPGQTTGAMVGAINRTGYTAPCGMVV